MIFFVVFVLVLGVFKNVQVESQSVLPSDFPVCKRSAPDLSACARLVVDEWSKIFRDGIESLNVKTTDPLTFGRVNFVYDNGFIKGLVSLKKVRIVGISGMEVPNLSIKINGTEITADQEIFIPKLHLTGAYRGEFSIAGIKLRPNGYLEGSLYNFTLFSKHKAHTYDRDNGYTYVNIDGMKNRVAVDHVKVNVTGLGIDQFTNDALVEFINKNWKQIFDAMAPDTVNIWTPYAIKRLNAFCKQVPIFID